MASSGEVVEQAPAEPMSTESAGEPCPCLLEEAFRGCSARWGNPRPNLSEMNGFCHQSRYSCCPVYRRFMRTGRKLTRWEYVVEKLKRPEGRGKPDALFVTFEP